MLEHILLGLAGVGIPAVLGFKYLLSIDGSLPKILRRNYYNPERAISLNNFLCYRLSRRSW